ncbi:transcriptional regulator, TetR family [Lentzea fradiae]|uniref:Transcriptional regulator, TetR family n=1 Tax=Lentzea fradiae TaxID=200378 RepID=A0A1G7V8F5_9PSEU|nr:TetR/AcrR family transcriptional regulator [Lentzea fradiae]SDG55848.1 transcriptional regulator, TetR family [Lentzea fradiae]
MSSTGQRRIDEIGDESRRRILDAAEELFAERGFERTSFVDIAKRSGISRGSIPWHFKNKDGLVMAVVERAVERLWPSSRYDYIPSLTEVFAETAQLMHDGNASLVFMMLVEALNDRGVVHEQYQEFLSRRREGIETLLRLRRPADADPDTAVVRERTAAVALNGALLGIHLQALVDPDDVDMDAALVSLATMFDRNIADVWRDDEAAPEGE